MTERSCDQRVRRSLTEPRINNGYDLTFSSKSIPSASFQSIMDIHDDETHELILQVEIEEARARWEKAGGKAPVTSRITDEQMAIKVYLHELLESLQVLRDNRFAHSMDKAVGSDADLLSLYQDLDQLEISDRAMALKLSEHGSVRGSDVQRTVRSSLTSYPSKSTTHTSTAAGSLRSPANSRRGLVQDRCVICMEVIGSKTHLRVPCSHFYDEKCFVALIQSASKDESIFPPRCCQQAIPQDSFLDFLTMDVRREFEKAVAEFSVKPRDRIYCSNATCSEFLVAQVKSEMPQSLRCPECTKRTCSLCRKAAHPHVRTCEVEDSDSKLDSLVEANNWKRCPECYWVIELAHGCYHITCRCKAQFCYLCTAQWKSCKCPQWEERNLLAEAERRVDAELMEGAVNTGRAPAPAAERRDRVHAMTNQLRENHVCRHNWYVKQGAANCENCYNYLNRYLLSCRNCYIDVCVRCARNRM